MSETSSRQLPQLPHWALATAGLLALGLLLVELGFPLSAESQRHVMLATTVVLWAGVAAEIGVIVNQAQRWRYIRRHLGTCAVTLLLLISLLIKPQVLVALAGWWPRLSDIRVESLFLGGLQLTLLGRLSHRALHFNRVLAFTKVSPRFLLIGSFVGLILAGTVLLKMPRATLAPGQLGWLDALFTSTSAVCVTGLAVVDTSVVFSEFGRVVLMGLFQLGGLGLMTFAYFFVSAFAGVTLKDRAMLLDILNEEDFGKITGALAAIFLFTFAFEAIGTVLLHLAMDPARADWLDSAFHAVSAFCNAGFSVYGLGLADPATRDNVGFQTVIMVLIVGGGLGFPVLQNLWNRLCWLVFDRRSRPPRITTHTKTVLVTTGALILGGAVLVYGFEFGGTAASAANTPLSALFTSVTARTAGFNTVPMELLTPAATLVVIALMFIGGAPASTAGGIKVTTFAIALLNTLRILRRPDDELVAFGRRIPAELAHRAFAIALLALLWVGLEVLILCALVPERAPLDLVFEAVSAFGTVGLSRGLTPNLPALAKLVLIASMLVGRVGILYAALGVAGRAARGRVSYPTANIIIS